MHQVQRVQLQLQRQGVYVSEAEIWAGLSQHRQETQSGSLELVSSVSTRTSQRSDEVVDLGSTQFALS